IADDKWDDVPPDDRNARSNYFLVEWDALVGADNARAEAQQKADILLLGDGYFSRWSADGQGGLNSAFPGRSVINRATAGKGTYVTLQAVRSHVDIAPRVVIIQVGIADVPFFEAGKETVYPQLVEQLRSLYPQASLVLTSTIMQGG